MGDRRSKARLDLALGATGELINTANDSLRPFCFHTAGHPLKDPVLKSRLFLAGIPQVSVCKDLKIIIKLKSLTNGFQRTTFSSEKGQTFRHY